MIGGHAVNAWLEPRFTADIDVALQADPDVMARLKEVLAKRGYRVTREHGADLQSGPDLVRFVSDRESVTLEVQKAKTELQRECLRRAAVPEAVFALTSPALLQEAAASPHALSLTRSAAGGACRIPTIAARW